MIKNYSKTTDYMVSWIKNYATKAGAKTLVLGLSGGIDSALCALLIKRTGIRLVCVNMPCHSSPSAYNRAREFADDNGFRLLKVDLSEAHAVISKQSIAQVFPSADWDFESNGTAGALRSCLRAPTLSFLAHATNGIIVGTGNRSEDRITRYFQKFGDGCVDFSPIADLFKSEVYALFKYLAEDDNGGTMSSGAAAIYYAKPSADLWGADAGQEDEKQLGMSYDEIEWADREDVSTQWVMEGIAGHNQDVPGIIFLDTPPSKHSNWGSYTSRQKEILTELHRMEKISRHKANPVMPVCLLHGETDFVE